MAMPRKPSITEVEQAIAHLRVIGADHLAEDIEDRIEELLPKWALRNRRRTESFAAALDRAHNHGERSR